MITQMKTIAQYFAVVLISILYKVALTFESVDEILSAAKLKSIDDIR